MSFTLTVPLDQSGIELQQLVKKFYDCLDQWKAAKDVPEKRAAHKAEADTFLEKHRQQSPETNYFLLYKAGREFADLSYLERAFRECPERTADKEKLRKLFIAASWKVVASPKRSLEERLVYFNPLLDLAGDSARTHLHHGLLLAEKQEWEGTVKALKKAHDYGEKSSELATALTYAIVQGGGRPNPKFDFLDFETAAALFQQNGKLPLAKEDYQAALKKEQQRNNTEKIKELEAHLADFDSLRLARERSAAQQKFDEAFAARHYNSALAQLQEIDQHYCGGKNDAVNATLERLTQNLALYELRLKLAGAEKEYQHQAWGQARALFEEVLDAPSNYKTASAQDNLLTLVLLTAYKEGGLDQLHDALEISADQLRSPPQYLLSAFLFLKRGVAEEAEQILRQAEFSTIRYTDKNLEEIKAETGLLCVAEGWKAYKEKRWSLADSLLTFYFSSLPDEEGKEVAAPAATPAGTTEAAVALCISRYKQNGSVDDLGENLKTYQPFLRDDDTLTKVLKSFYLFQTANLEAGVAHWPGLGRGYTFHDENVEEMKQEIASMVHQQAQQKYQEGQWPLAGRLLHSALKAENLYDPERCQSLLSQILICEYKISGVKGLGEALTEYTNLFQGGVSTENKLLRAFYLLKDGQGKEGRALLKEFGPGWKSLAPADQYLLEIVQETIQETSIWKRLGGGT